MRTASRDRDYERLIWEIGTGKYQDLLKHMQLGTPFFRQFPKWSDVIAFMRQGTSQDPLKDEILRPILMAHGKDQDHRWRTILLVVFWPALRSIQRKRGHYDRNEPDELWQRTFWAFHQTICAVNLKHRNNRLVQWIYNTTLCHLRDEYRRDWRREAREVRSESAPIEQVADIRGIDFDGIDRRIAEEIEIESLREHLAAGRIKEADFLLILGTRIYGQSIREYASGVGLNAEAAKKRRLRAEAAIRRFENEMR